MANTFQIGGGFASQAFVLVNPYSGNYGGQYGYVLDFRVRAPHDVQWVPAPLIGLDGIGTPVVRGFPQMVWHYPELRPDYWYFLLNLYNQSGRAPVGFQYLVLLQYYDPPSGNYLQTLARWDPPTHTSRTVGAYLGVQLLFTYVGQSILLSTVPIVSIFPA